MPPTDLIRSRDPARPTPRAGVPAGLLADFREQIAQELGIHFANGDLTMGELERRLELAFSAPSPAALDDLVADLPPLGPDLQPSVLQAAAPPEGSSDRTVLAAFMGGVARKGAWAVPRHLKVVAIWGGAELDLRQARFAPGVTEIEVFALMGGVEVYLPVGVRVEAVGMAVMGAFEATGADPAEYDPDAPVIRLSGLAIMGAVEAKTKRPSTKALRKVSAAVAKARRRAARTDG